MGAAAQVNSAAAAIGGVALRAFMNTGDELDKMRQRTGFSVEALSELRHAADQSGSSIEDLEAKAMQNMARDASGALVYLAPTRVNLQLTVERYPKLRFAATKEHAQPVEM